jgi:hypothetical protein
MAFDQNEPTQAKIDELFHENLKVPKGTFELGLVLGGTVSAGAYTAGVLDFLIEALDCWDAERSDRPAVASSGLGAYLGFACSDFMRYDYMLGRLDCRQLLLREFILDENNGVVFGTLWSASQKTGYAAHTRARFLPIIPLMGTAASEQDLDPWPAGKLDPARYRQEMQKRYRAILRAETPNSKWLRAASWLAGHVGDGYIADKVIDTTNASLTLRGLC